MAELTKADRTPPAKVAANAKKGLELRERFHRGGTEVGEHRGEQLSKREVVSKDDVKAIYSYFARHAVDKRPNWGDPAKPTAGYVAWLLWGGDEGKAWIDKVHGKLEKD